MRKLMIAVAVVFMTVGTLFASEQSDVVDTVNRFLDAFNKGDTKTVLALCMDDMSMLDEFPPHEWHGAGAMSKWSADYEADSKKKGVTDGKVTMGKPRHVDVTGDRAYVVAPANYTYKQNGKPMKEDGEDTYALQKGKDGWRITGWCWAKH